MKTIANLRQEIDQLHQELHHLLLRRRDLTLAIWKIKQEQGLPFLSSEREQQIINDFENFEKESINDNDFVQLKHHLMTTLLREYESYLRKKFKDGPT